MTAEHFSYLRIHETGYCHSCIEYTSCVVLTDGKTIDANNV